VTPVSGPPSDDRGREILLNVGCGTITPEGWVNIDASWNARLAAVPWLRPLLAGLHLIPVDTAKIPWPRNIRYRDVRRGLPYPEGAVAAVYSSHMIEHLSREEALRFLNECRRVLRGGGIIRLVTPDLEILARRYVAEKDRGGSTEQMADRLIIDLNVIQLMTGTSALTRLYRRWMSYDSHKWLYDEESLGALLSEAGFTGIARKAYLQSQIPSIQDVEREDRVVNNLCIEALKP
jgi:predicted SAM-dependent methyltransferase